MKTHKFARKPFYVDAVRVSEANLQEVAEWCKGAVSTTNEGHAFIEVEVYRPITPRQTQAFIGDWVLFSGNGFKVYTPKAFDKAFEKVKTLTKEQADAAGIKVPHEPRTTPVKGNIRVTQKGKSVDVPTAPPSVRQAMRNVGKAVREADEAVAAQKEPVVINQLTITKSPEDIEAERVIAEFEALKRHKA